MSQRNNILEELNSLGSSLASGVPVTPYLVPDGYFETLIPKLLSRIRAEEGNSAEVEIKSLSPLLAGMNRKMPYAVPERFFDNVAQPVRREAKVISINRQSWFRYVAAVIVVGLLAATAIVITRNNDIDRMEISRFEKKLNKEIGKMSDTELTNFLEYSEAGLTGAERVNSRADEEVRDMLEDIPVSELKEFIEETTIWDAETLLN